MNASLLHVRPACATEKQRFQDLMQAHHYLGALVKIGNTIRYFAQGEIALNRKPTQKHKDTI
ncbi:MAG: hypothetical protein AB2814_03305 [Candidatus Sedimenticola endophacoides]